MNNLKVQILRKKMTSYSSIRIFLFFLHIIYFICLHIILFSEDTLFNITKKWNILEKLLDHISEDDSRCPNLQYHHMYHFIIQEKTRTKLQCYEKERKGLSPEVAATPLPSLIFPSVSVAPENYNKERLSCGIIIIICLVLHFIFFVGMYLDSVLVLVWI
jgi:hypothetical protein